jgi:GT2 family glycosyltransferase
LIEDPSVSIIIVNYNGKNHLEKCLKSLSEIIYKNYQIVLVDNNSSDGSVEFTTTNYPKVKIIQLDKNYGFAEPNNIGAKNAVGEFLLFLNNDTIVTTNFLNSLVNVASSDPDIAICQSLLLRQNGDIDSSGDFVDTLGMAYSSHQQPSPDISPILSARGASMLVKKNIFFELGGFDKKYFASFEDVDVGWRAWIWGYKVLLVPDSIVYHFGGQTIGKMNDLMRFHGLKNLFVTRLVNFELPCAIRGFLGFFVVRFMKKVGINVKNTPNDGLKGKTSTQSLAKTLFLVLLWLVQNSDYILKKRRQVNSRRIRSTKDLISLGLIKDL